MIKLWNVSPSAPDTLPSESTGSDNEQRFDRHNTQSSFY